MNTDIRVDVGFLDHWKTDTLIATLGSDAVLSAHADMDIRCSK